MLQDDALNGGFVERENNDRWRNPPKDGHLQDDTDAESTNSDLDISKGYVTGYDDPVTLPSQIGDDESGLGKKCPLGEDLEVSEGGWGWVCVAAISVVSFLQRGNTSVFTLVYQQLRIKFNSSATETGWVYSIFVMLNMCFSPVVAALLKRFNCRKVAFCGALLYSLGIITSGFTSSLAQLYVTFGIAGLGSGMISTAGPVILNYYFAKKRSLAMALSLITNGLGGAVFAPLVSFLFVYYGYTGTMMIAGALLLHIAAATIVYVIPKKFRKKSKHITKDKEEKIGSDGNCEKDKDFVKCSLRLSNGNHQYQSQSKGYRTRFRETLRALAKHIDLSILRRRSFAFYCFMMWSYSFAMSVNSVVIADFFADRHMTKYQIAALMSVYSGVSIPARLVIGFTCDRPRARSFRVLIYGVSISLMGLFFTIGPLTYNAPSLFVWYITFGILGSLSSSQEVVIIADLVGAKQLPDGVGISKFFRGFGVLMGPTFGGILADRTGNYNYTYICAGFLLMFTSHIFWIHSLIEKNRKATLNKKQDQIKM